MSIALKEARETNYWLRLLLKSNYLEDMNILNESSEIKKIIGSIIINTKKNLTWNIILKLLRIWLIKIILHF